MSIDFNNSNSWSSFHWADAAGRTMLGASCTDSQNRSDTTRNAGNTCHGLLGSSFGGAGRSNTYFSSFSCTQREPFGIISLSQLCRLVIVSRNSLTIHVRFNASVSAVRALSESLCCSQKESSAGSNKGSTVDRKSSQFQARRNDSSLSNSPAGIPLHSPSPCNAWRPASMKKYPCNVSR